MVLPTPSSVTSTTIFVGKVLDQCADDQFAGRQGQLTADLHALGVAGQAYRNGD